MVKKTLLTGFEDVAGVSYTLTPPSVPEDQILQITDENVMMGLVSAAVKAPIHTSVEPGGVIVGFDMSQGQWATFNGLLFYMKAADQQTIDFLTRGVGMDPALGFNAFAQIIVAGALGEQASWNGLVLHSLRPNVWEPVYLPKTLWTMYPDGTTDFAIKALSINCTTSTISPLTYWLDSFYLVDFDASQDAP